MTASEIARAIRLGEYLSAETARAEPDWRQIAMDALSLAAIAEAAGLGG